MSGGAAWPGDVRGALSLTFDNLGEAAELELGAIGPDAPLGDHFTATRVLPALLDALAERGLTATFFVEGLNAELYPDALAAIVAAGHELGYHAWRHEQWTDLSADKQTENLARGLIGFRALGIELAGLRPPGGGLGPDGLDVLREAGLRYCSPAGSGAGFDDGIALLPFQWRHVDASCVLPPLAPVRKGITGSSEPLDPPAFLTFLEAELDALAREGSYATIVLHPFMLDWLGWERLGALLDRIARESERGDLWVAPCAEVATHVLAHEAAFAGGATLDPTSWTDAGSKDLSR
jgi:peptidoglycan/xylan/chitin deacetylase (PgdA/CDA1 family)